MKFNFAVICENAFLDRDNRLSIIQIFDGISSSRFPTAHPTLSVVLVFALEPGEDGVKHSMELQIFNPSGEKIALIKVDLTPPKDSKKIQVISKFDNLIFKEAGRYSVKVYIDGNESIAPIPLEVKPVSEPDGK